MTPNNFVIRFANVNGTGSASANGLVAKCLFRMGLAIGPKNMFPSNIQGMPTWFEVRVSSKGYTGRRGGADLLVAMNGQSLEQDCGALAPGAYVLYDATMELAAEKKRPGLNYLPLPVSALARDSLEAGKSRLLIQNLVYVGALQQLLALDSKVLLELLEDQYQSRKELLPKNLAALKLGSDYAQAHFPERLPFYAESRVKESAERIIMTGNQGLALGALYAGATVCSWYPITPSTSVIEYFSRYCRAYRQDPKTGEKRYAIVQAEDEIAAIGMVLGASWNGSRAFTATSGPGISLMTEFLGYAHYAEIPAVLFNIQRCGPSTGMPTRTQQSDILLCAFAAHGDTQHILLFPKDPKECFDFGVLAFDLAERWQNPVIVMSDLELGMNEFLCEPLTWDDHYQPDRGKVLDKAALDQRGEKPFFRYLDEDGDAIPYRTYPGVDQRGAYFTRGSGHDKFGRYTESSPAYVENMERIKKKFELLRGKVPPSEIVLAKGSKVGIVAYGSTWEPLWEAVDILAVEGLHADLLRIRSFPFAYDVEEFFANHDRVIVVEQNRDGQMRALLAIQGIGGKGVSSLLSYDGLPLTAEFLALKLKGLLKPAT